MQIKQKLILNTSVVVVSLVILIIAFLFAEIRLKELIQGKEMAQRQESEMLLLRRHEKDFLARGDEKYVSRFEDVAQRIIEQQSALDAMFIKSGVDVKAFSNLTSLFGDYRNKFVELVDAKKAMGLSPDEGLEGQLRSAVHDIETALKTLDQPAIMVTMLQLRRHEKDFMLRLDAKYFERFETTISTLLSQLQTAKISNGEKQSLTNLAEIYHSKFSDYIAQQQRIGLSSEEGILGEMRHTIHQTETKLEAMVSSMSQQTESLLTRVEWLMTSLFFVIALIASLVAWRVGASINRPLAAIREAMLEIDRSRDLSLRVTYQGKDEIGDVARSINQMLEGFQKVVGSVNETVLNMKQQTQQLSQTAEHTAKDAERQRDETDLVAASVAQMVGTIEDISRNMEVAADKSQNAQQSVSDGQTRVNSAVSLVNKLSGQLQSSVLSAQELAKESESIGTVLNVIQDIAEQTNLLALNAAIEAARAGEQGRGFAVVADEVRALASRTHDATVEISDIINSLQQRTQSIVTIMQSCGEEGQRSRDEASVIGDVLERITREVNEISVMAQSVASAIGQQSVAANEINRNVVIINEISMDTTEAVRLNSRSSHDISELAHQLEDVVSRFKL
ncbi:methyl-accepting chemotaxis protein [Marinomonas ostreistagni]|uniref:Methyl-accepting chemotaxis protein n=1 Tax=Marinomonas ostreistagni TaxID=359209 RepID=A0ABS0ZCH7_9GAMM|nr:methyl-accepting chemotaxis protein [Marinomonas ostreistagni]MBJ7551368.1 methyl-accepting chemotaxis protein [Marinomonas ostreistagni]